MIRAFRFVASRLWRFVWFRWLVTVWVHRCLPFTDFIAMHTPFAIALHQHLLSQGMFAEARDIAAALRRHGYLR